MKAPRRSIIFFSLLVATLASGVLASPAWAIQDHGPAEGLISHELGHLLFFIGMGYMLYRVYRTPLVGPGWFEFKGFLWLILFWNGLTFSGHLLRQVADPAKFLLVDGRITGYTISDLADLVFYISCLDHLVLVPSFLFLLLALKKWRQCW